jgi:hypothetical protein
MKIFPARNNVAPTDDDTSIGNLLLKSHLITREQLKHAIRVQEKKAPLGQILVDMGVLDKSDLTAALFQQRLLRGKDTRADRKNYKKTVLSDLKNLTQSTKETTMRVMRNLKEET